MATTTALKDTHVSFFSVTPNNYFNSLFERADIQNVLISYHYIRQNPALAGKMMQEVRERGGLFMTDSGAFSFLNDKSFDPKKFDWDAYVVEYTDWLTANKEHVFVACNLDVDNFVGHDKVKYWNRTYFEPLERHMNIAYVAHPMGTNSRDTAMVKEYCKDHDYIAVSEEYAPVASDIYQEAKRTKTTVHGLAWTKPTILLDFPFFSVDSTSWVNYQKFGATPVWDRTNFMQYDKDNKHIRRTLKKQCQAWGIGFEQFCTEKNDDGSHNDSEGLTWSLLTWKEVLDNVKKKSRTKLKTTIADLLENRSTVFEPRKGGIANLLANGDSPDMQVEDATGASNNEYATDEETGAEIPVYKKREGPTISPADFKAAQGTGGLFCSNCLVNDKCPMFKPQSSCAFNFGPSSQQSPMELLDGIIAQQQERVARAMFFEQMEGGLPNKAYSQELMVLARLNQMKTDMIVRSQQTGVRMTVVMEQNGPVALPAAPGQAALPAAAPAGGGMMAMLAAVMGQGAPNPMQPQVIPLTPTEEA